MLDQRRIRLPDKLEFVLDEAIPSSSWYLFEKAELGRRLIEVNDETLSEAFEKKHQSLIQLIVRCADLEHEVDCRNPVRVQRLEILSYINT